MIFRRLLLATFILAGFVPFPFLMSTDDMFILLDSVAVAVGVGVIIAYGRGVYSGVNAPYTTAAHMLILGIFITWISLNIRILWMQTTRIEANPYPPEFLNHWILAWTVYLVIIGGSLHLLANRAIEDRIPPSGWVTLLLCIALGLIVGIALIAVL